MRQRPEAQVIEGLRCSNTIKVLLTNQNYRRLPDGLRSRILIRHGTAYIRTTLHHLVIVVVIFLRPVGCRRCGLAVSWLFLLDSRDDICCVDAMRALGVLCTVEVI